MDKFDKALKLRFDSDAGDDLTVKEYFKVLLTTLWEEEEGFSGKRPFGNSAWQYDVYEVLIKGGFIPGTLDEDGYIEDVDMAVADKFILKLIERIFE